MKFYEYQDNVYTINELSEMSGIAPHTLRARLRQGYNIEEAIAITPTHESVREFAEASWYKDWIGMSTSYLYQIYWSWCIEHGYTPIQIQGFTRQIMKLYPNLKTVPTRKKTGCVRIIRHK